MQIDVRVSRDMDLSAEKGMNERRLIRMPRDFRELCEFSIGDFVYLRTFNGDVISLMVEKAFDADVAKEPLVAYVTSEVHNLVCSKTCSISIELVDGITLGCDPELIILDKQSGIYGANRIFKKYDAVGSDGLLLEFRPLPSTEASVVTNHLAAMIATAEQTIKNRSADLFMIARSAYNQVTAGFHLHYGLPGPLLGMNKRFVADQIVKVLDYYVGVISIIPEGNADSFRRTAAYMEYGKPGNYRIDNRTLEYRVPGATLMRHPSWAEGLLSLGAVVVEDAVSRIRMATNNFSSMFQVSDDMHIRELYPNIPTMMDIFSIICNPHVELARTHIDRIYHDVRQMVGYARRSAPIDAFFNDVINNVQYSMVLEPNWRWRSYGQRQSGQMAVH